MTWSSEGWTPGTKISPIIVQGLHFTKDLRLRMNSQERIEVLRLKGLIAVGSWWWSGELFKKNRYIFIYPVNMIEMHFCLLKDKRTWLFELL